MRLRFLHHRIVVVFVGLLIVVMCLILAAVRASSERVVANEVRREFAVAAEVFTRLLEQNRHQLEMGATVLSADFAFREAIATRDGATMGSAIRNHGERIGARVMMVASPDGKLLASTQGTPDAAARFPFPDLVTAATESGRSAGFRQMKNGSVVQLVLVPVLAPRRIAWVAIGFEVDDRWARDMSAITGLEVSIIRMEPGAHAVLTSSLPPARRQDLAGFLSVAGEGNGAGTALDDSARRSMQLPLAPGLSVLLQRSVEDVQAPFQALERTLLMLLGAGVAAFALGSVMLSRRIVKPLKQLTSAARRIETGDYAHALPALPPDEIGQLAGSFDRMREGIASREERIVRLAYVDSLTDLPNRTRLLARFNELPATQPAAIAILNLDGFSLINNALGHVVGDQLLRMVSQRLLQVVQAPALLARMWGDQFAVLVPGAGREAAAALGQALLDALQDPISLQGQRLDIGASIGIALHPQDGMDAATLLRRAEVAMTCAKARRNSLGFAGDAGAEPLPEQLSLIGDMREAMANGHLVLHYQPKLALSPGGVTAVEALLRWCPPGRPVIAPARFIPFAEQTGFIREITPWVLESVVKQLAAWQRDGLGLSISANLSALDLLDPGLPGRVARLLEQYSVQPALLCLEITESALMENQALAIETLGRLAALGVKLSIDDYGVGQASLAYLKSLPVHELKIDRAFIGAIPASRKDAAIVESTIMLCHALGLSVVAEGVEDNDQLAWLREHACDLAQGYGIGRPMAAQQLQAWLAARQPQGQDVRA